MKSREEFKEFSGLGSDELQKRIGDIEHELMGIRFRHASGQLDQTAKLRTLRQSIARARTALNAQRDAG